MGKGTIAEGDPLARSSASMTWPSGPGSLTPDVKARILTATPQDLWEDYIRDNAIIALVL